MRPLKQFVLIEEVKEPDQEGIIIIPDFAKDKGPIKRGVVLEIGPDVDSMPNSKLKGYGVGSIVLYHAAYELSDSGNKNLYLVPDSEIIGLAEESQKTLVAGSLMPLPNWDTFKNVNYDNWSEYTNIRSFTFRTLFLSHMIPKEVLHRVIYERCCHILTIEEEVGGQYISMTNANGDKALEVKIQEDKFDATFTLRADRFELHKQDTNMQNLVETLPALMRVLRSILQSPEFRQVLGQDCQRIAMTTVAINQNIRLTGRGLKGKEKVRNWEVMRKLLRLETEGKTQEKTLFGSLGPKGKALGRTDVTIGFEKEIDGHIYDTFLEVQAPTNEQSTLLAIQWQIQDPLPGLLPERDYSHLLTTFFRNTVLCQFYQDWFSDVHCTTLGNK